MKLNAKHLQAIEFLADPFDERSYDAKAEAAGISRVTLWRILKEPEAQQRLRERTDALVSANRSIAYRALYNAMRKGDMKGVEIFLRACGDIASGGHQVVNVTQTNTEPLPDAINRIHRERARALETDDEG